MNANRFVEIGKQQLGEGQTRLLYELTRRAVRFEFEFWFVSESQAIAFWQSAKVLIIKGKEDAA